MIPAVMSHFFNSETRNEIHEIEGVSHSLFHFVMFHVVMFHFAMFHFAMFHSAMFHFAEPGVLATEIRILQRACPTLREETAIEHAHPTAVLVKR